MFSYDSRCRTSGALIINGVPVEAMVHRDASVFDGRYALVYGDRWRAYALTWSSIPTGVLHDEGNTIQVPIKGQTYIVGACIARYDPARCEQV